MKKCLILVFLISSLFLLAEDIYQFYDNTGNPLDMETVISRAEENDVVFFGEFHDDALIHQLELKFLQGFYKKNPEIIVSMEMFETDTQDILNDYLTDNIEEAIFIEKSRAWPNYLTDYKPIVECAKSWKIDVLAANIPRRYAAVVNKKGFDALEPESKAFVAEKHVVLKDKYYENFVATMKANMASQHGMPMDEEMIDSFYAAQCIKDDTMAEFIDRVFLENPEKKVIHYNGDFHSSYHLGTVQKLQRLNPNLNIVVISPIYSESDDAVWLNEYSNFGDYLLVISQ